MGTLCPGKLAINRKRMIRELVEGKKFACQLQVLLQKPFGEDGSVSAEGLAGKILRSFTQTLSVLTSSCDGDDHEVSDDQNQQQQTGSCIVSPCSDGRRVEDSGESKKKRPGSREKRGCYKRKKNSLTWTVVTSTMDDGYAWRKYGQKNILNAKHPRSYFRCTHKYDQGCRATKQVQRMDEDPQKLEIIYVGNHTCRDILRCPQVIPDSDPWSVSTVAAGNSHSVMSSSSTIPRTTQVKQECKEETTSTDDDLSTNLGSVILWDDVVMPDFQSSYDPAAADNMNMVSLQMGSSFYSCSKMISSHSLGAMDIDHEFHNIDEFF